MKKQNDGYTEQETMRRMNEALKRALNMPPKPHKPTTSKKQARKPKLK